LRKEAPEICLDPPGVDRAALHAQLDTDILDFFNRKLAQK
jgi:predicted dienelactone hydrolase